MNRAEQSPGTVDSPRQRVFAALFGCFLGLTLLKFGNPPIMEKWVTPPTNALEVVLNCPWPISWAYGLLFGLAILALFAGRWTLDAPKWLLLLPLAWLGWQVAASTQTIDPQLSHPTLAHFVACCVCLSCGYFCLGGLKSLDGFLAGLTIGFLLVLATGFQQHFGGLEQTRRYFYAYIYPQMQEVPPEYLKKMSSTRIFSTLFYPNALAGAILMLTPTMLAFIAGARRWFTSGARGLLLLAVGLPAIACLYWSGSKGGWLLLLPLAFLALLRLPINRRIKVLLVGCVLLGGLTAFGWKYAGFFKKGATSVVARFDYWNAAFRTAAAHPVLGTGPGTFAKPYQQLKKPESEMSRLVHNDYLEQASDSGWPGFILYTAFLVGALVYAYPRRAVPHAARAIPPAPGFGSPSDRNSQQTAHLVLSRPQTANWLPFATWLGVLGWALQGLFEFGLYLPALAWPAFAFLGLLMRRRSGHSR